MTVVQQSPQDRTFLNAVSRILIRCGKSDIGTLVQPSRHTSLAMGCVQDARDEVYYRTLWEFRRSDFRIAPVENTMWYTLPEDYFKMDTDLSKNEEGLLGIQYISWEQLIAQYPALRSFPPGSPVVDLSSLSQFIAQTNTFGAPSYYCIRDGYIGLFPVPDADFVEDQAYLYAQYWKQAGELQSDNDSLGLPRHLWNCHHYLALAQFKKALEMSDWVADEEKGRLMLSRASSGKTEKEDTTNDTYTTFNYNE